MQDFSSLTQALEASSLKEIRQQVLIQLKAHPQDLKAREVLFKLYCVEGRWEKALIQLQTLALLDDGLQKHTELCKNMVFSEMQRLQVIIGERQAATLLNHMPEWMAKLHQANVEHYQGNIKRSAHLRDEAFLIAPESGGRSDTLGKFTWIADSDSRLGPVCEFVCAGGYRWVPFSSIQRLSVSVPGDLLDLLWIPATLKVVGEDYHGYIPARYPLGPVDDQSSKLGLKTEWTAMTDRFLQGSGRKVFATDVSEHAIMEVGDIVFG